MFGAPLRFTTGHCLFQSAGGFFCCESFKRDSQGVRWLFMGVCFSAMHWGYFDVLFSLKNHLVPSPTLCFARVQRRQAAL